MKNRITALLTRPGVAWATGLLALVFLALLLWQMFSPLDPASRLRKSERAAIEAVVRAYILEHPEIIPEAINRLQSRAITQLLDANRKEIETPYAGAWAGAKDGDVILVEFFDYNCPYCKVMHAELQKLLAQDKKLKIVYRDYPVLGETSVDAAMASLSAARQGRYVAFQKQLLSIKGQVTQEAIVEAVRAAGMNEMQTAQDMRSEALRTELQKNRELGSALGMTGTPSYVVGHMILSGAKSHEELAKAIAEVRAARKN